MPADGRRLQSEQARVRLANVRDGDLIRAERRPKRDQLLLDVAQLGRAVRKAVACASCGCLCAVYRVF